MVYGSDESARTESYAVTFPGLTGRIQISASGAMEPVWSRAGRELFYRAEDALVAVSIDPAPRLEAGRPAVLFRTAFISGSEHVQSCDVLPDDRGFLVLRTPDGTDRSSINVVHHWSEELKAKVPAK